MARVATSRVTAARDVEVVTRLSQLDSLRSSWDALAADGSGCPTQQFAWARACAESFPDQALRIVAVRRGEDAAAIAPLSLREASKRLQLLGVSDLYEPSDLLFRDHEALCQLAGSIAASGFPLLFARIDARSPTIGTLRRAFGRRAAVVTRPAGATPVIFLDESWREPEQNVNAGRRSDLRRARRRAEQLGAVTFELVAPSPDELSPLLGEIFAVEEAGWKGRAGTALAHDRVRGEFYRRYAAAAAGTGSLRLAFLRIGGRAAAVQIAAESGGRFWLLKIGYDEQFARCSPGTLLMVETIRAAAASRLRAYEFLGNAEAWIRFWTSEERPCVSLRVYPLRSRGLTMAAADARAVARRQVGDWLGRWATAR